MKQSFKTLFILSAALAIGVLAGCGGKQEKKQVNVGDAPAKVYVAPGKLDKYYEFLSGGFSGQVSVYGLPSCRLLKVIPVFAKAKIGKIIKAEGKCKKFSKRCEGEVLSSLRAEKGIANAKATPATVA